MANDIEFVDGLIVKAPHEKAPDYVKANISIKVADLTKWLQGKSDEWVNIDVKQAKSTGKWYAAVSTFKPKEKQEEAPTSKRVASRPDDGSVAGMEDDIPFSPIRKVESFAR